MNSREKGKRVELKLVHELKKYGFDVRRGQQYSGANGDADVVGIDGIHIECKGVENLNIREAIKQSYRDSRPGEYPVVMHKKNRKPWRVTMLAEDLASMYNFWPAGVVQLHLPDGPLAEMSLEDWVRMYRAVTE